MKKGGAGAPGGQSRLTQFFAAKQPRVAPPKGDGNKKKVNEVVDLDLSPPAPKRPRLADEEELPRGIAADSSARETAAAVPPRDAARHYKMQAKLVV